MVQSFESAMSVASFLGPTQTPERAAGKKKEAANTSSKSNGNKQTLAVMQLNQWVSKDLQNIKTAVTIVEAEVRRFFLARVLAKEQLRAEQQRLEVHQGRAELEGPGAALAHHRQRQAVQHLGPRGRGAARGVAVGLRLLLLLLLLLLHCRHYYF